MNFYPIHRILLIWPLATFFCVQIRMVRNEGVIAATEAHFADPDKTYYLEGIKKLEHRRLAQLFNKHKITID